MYKYTIIQVDFVCGIKWQKRGFFVEAGANDGERASNTLWMEEKMGWTGLLIEPDPYFYTQILGKSRKSWSINACLSPYPYPVMVCKGTRHFELKY